MSRDLHKMADLIESFGSNAKEVHDFVNKCKTSHNISNLSAATLLNNLSKSFHDFTVIDELGSGSFGQVLRVIDCLIDKEFAIKRIKIERSKSRTPNNATKEVKNLSCLENRHIVKFYRSWRELTYESEYKSFEELLKSEPMDVDGASGPPTKP